MHFRLDDGTELRFFSTMTVFGSPLDVTIAETRHRELLPRRRGDRGTLPLSPIVVVRLLTVRESDAMKGQLNVKTPAEYIAAVDDKRRSDIAALDALIRKHAPKLEPVIMGGMLGYGPFHYRYASGREGDACKLSIASNTSYISLYCFAADAKGSVAERYVDRLPKASIGKSCVRFKKLADLDEKALVALIKETARMGLAA